MQCNFQSLFVPPEWFDKSCYGCPYLGRPVRYQNHRSLYCSCALLLLLSVPASVQIYCLSRSIPAQDPRVGLRSRKRIVRDWLMMPSTATGTRYPATRATQQRSGDISEPTIQAARIPSIIAFLCNNSPLSMSPGLAISITRPVLQFGAWWPPHTESQEPRVPWGQ